MLIHFIWFEQELLSFKLLIKFIYSLIKSINLIWIFMWLLILSDWAYIWLVMIKIMEYYDFFFIIECFILLLFAFIIDFLEIINTNHFNWMSLIISSFNRRIIWILFINYSFRIIFTWIFNMFITYINSLDNFLWIIMSIFLSLIANIDFW